MRFFSVIPAIGCVCLIACMPAQEIDRSEVSPSSSASVFSSSSSVQRVWKSYTNEKLGISIDYPSDIYSVHGEVEDVLLWEGGEIPYSGIIFGDAQPEGNRLHIQRTTDSEILDYIRPFIVGEKEFNGRIFSKFTFEGMANPYGYIIERDGTYYVFDSTWGPDNPITEQMMETLRFMENSP